MEATIARLTGERNEARTLVSVEEVRALMLKEERDNTVKRLLDEAKIARDESAALVLKYSKQIEIWRASSLVWQAKYDEVESTIESLDYGRRYMLPTVSTTGRWLPTCPKRIMSQGSRHYADE